MTTATPLPHAARATLTVCTITLNEEQRLPATLASVADIADEIIVVDSGSSDQTREIAARSGARVIRHPWAGFAQQRNVALDAATGDWVLELDADERVTPGLAAELRAFLALPPPPEICLGVIPMRHRYLGRFLGPAGRYPYYRPRLLRRGSYRHDETVTVHEGLLAQEAPWVFNSDLEHELAEGLSEALRDTWSYARLSAQTIERVTDRDLVVGVLGRPAAKFIFTTFLLGGIRDGLPGVTRLGLECVSDAVIWILARRRAARGAGPPVGHFGHRIAPQPPPHLLVVGDPRPHWSWLKAAAAAGWLVSVVCRADQAAARLSGGERLRVRATSGGPLALLRMVDAEAQISAVTTATALDRVGALVQASGRRWHPAPRRVTRRSPDGPADLYAWA
jgi:hypothetical protein